MSFFLRGLSCLVARIGQIFECLYERCLDQVANGFGVSGANQAVAGSNVLSFFEDELFGGNQNEAFVGSVDFIRIHDDASTFGQAPAVSSVSLVADAIET